MPKEELLYIYRIEFETRFGTDPDELDPARVKEMVFEDWSSQRDKEERLAQVLDAELETRIGVRPDEVSGVTLEAMRQTVAGARPIAERCPRCGGTGDEVRSPKASFADANVEVLSGSGSVGASNACNRRPSRRCAVPILGPSPKTANDEEGFSLPQRCRRGFSHRSHDQALDRTRPHIGSRGSTTRVCEETRHG